MFFFYPRLLPAHSLWGSQAIDIISTESDIHRRCVRALSKVCGIYRLLPDSHKIKSTLTTSQHAIASGGFSDIWKAKNEKGEEFAIKVLRIYQNNATQVTKVRQRARFPPSYCDTVISDRPYVRSGFQKYCREVIMSRRMNHPNVLRIEGVAPDSFACCMVSRWMDNGNMLEYLNQYQGHIDRLDLVSTYSDHVDECVLHPYIHSL